MLFRARLGGTGRPGLFQSGGLIQFSEIETPSLDPSRLSAHRPFGPSNSSLDCSSPG